MSSFFWTSETLVRFNRDYDQAHASDGYSRYGSYVGGHQSSFYDPWGENDHSTPLEPHHFTALAWRIASDGLIMSPGLVWRRADIQAVEVSAGGEDGMIVAVTLPLGHGMLGRRPPYRWQDWNIYRAETDGYFQHEQPEVRLGQDPSVLLTAQIEHAGPWGMVEPAHTTGRPLVDQCIESVEMMAKQINQVMGPMVRQLLEGDG